MGARKAPDESQNGDDRTRRRFGLPHVALKRWRRDRPSPEAVADAAPSSESPETAQAATAPSPRLPVLRAVPRLPWRRGAAPAVEADAAERAPTVASLPPPEVSLVARVRSSPLIAAINVVVIVAVLLAGITYYGAGQFSERAADRRATNEAASFARHSSTLATGDAFEGYIEILRYADDPTVHDKAALPSSQVAAMTQLLYLNSNRLASLTIADRSGLVLATTDPAITSVRDSPAFVATRSNLSPANSDVIVPEAGKTGYVEFATALRAPDGATWGVLLGRADPARLWRPTLAASVDGSTNVIINSDGQFAAGVPDALLGQPWHGAAVGDGGVRADIAGTDSICGLAPIGPNTQIDQGFTVASCLPWSIIQAESNRAMGKQGLVTIAAVVLAIMLGALMLRLGLRHVGGPRPAMPVDVASVEGQVEVAAASPIRSEPEQLAAVAPPIAPAPQLPIAPPPPVVVAPPPDIDALTLIEAYEERNERLAERLRETVQARLLIATAQADEAYKLAAVDADAAENLHRHALSELEAIRDHELRAIGQELHPGLVRLGLPGALRALRKGLAGEMDVNLDIDSTVDSIGASAGRSSIDPAMRLVLYRLAMEAARGLQAAGAGECEIALHRSGDLLVLRVAGTVSEKVGGRFDRSDVAASTLAVEAFAGSVAVSRSDSRVTVTAEVPAPPVAEYSAGISLNFDDDSTENAEPGNDAGEASAAPAQPLGLRTFRLEDDDGALDLAADAGDESDADDDDVEDAGPLTPPVVHTFKPKSEDEPPAFVSVASVPDEPVGLAEAIAALHAFYAGTMGVELAVEFDEEGVDLPPALHTALQALITASLRSLRASGATAVSGSLKHVDGFLMLSIMSETDGTPFDGAPLKEAEFAIEAFGGYVSVSRLGSSVSITTEVSASAEAAA